MVKRIFAVGGKGHSCGIYSFDDDHIHRLALAAPVSRIMVRQIQSSSNAGTFTNGMPMTSSMGCGVWGGNITNENISLKHYMNVTWVSRPSRKTGRRSRSCSESSTAPRSGSPRTGDTTMTTTADLRVDRAPGQAQTRIASYLLVEYLERLGVEVVFGLCGHTVIAFLDALGKSRIRFVTARHEQVAAHAADGYARASRKPGVLLTHLGPGLTNAATGVANAALDSIPMVVIAGDVPSHYYGRHPHQEVNLHQDADQFQIFRPFCKRVYRVDRAEDLPRTIERAFHLAQAGRPGPVLVDVPMDVFSADLPVGAFHQLPTPMARPALSGATAARIVDALAEAERPLIYAGGGVISAGATAELAVLAEALEVPVAHSLMAKGCMREDHPLLLGMTGFWGTPIGNEKCRTADVILAVGTRLAEANSSSWDPRYTFAIPPTRLIHIDVDPAEIGRNFPTELGVVADAKLALEALSAAARGRAGRKREGLRAGDRGGPAGLRRQLARPVGVRSVSPPAGEDPQRAAQGGARGRLHRDRRGLEQERCRPAVPDHGARDLHHAQWTGHHGLRPLGRARREAGAAAAGPRWPWWATAVSARIPPWWPRPWRPDWPWSGW